MTLSAVELKRAWDALLENPAFIAWQKVVQEQMLLRELQILESPVTPDTSLYEREALRGERNGLKLAVLTAKTMAEQAAFDLEIERTDNESAQAAETSPSL